MGMGMAAGEEDRQWVRGGGRECSWERALY